MSFTLRTSGVTLAAILALALVGCGSDEPAAPPAPAPTAATSPKPPPPPPEIPTNLSVDKKDAAGNPVAFSGTDPSGKSFEASIGEDVTIPASFPDDVPTFPTATPLASMSAAGEGAMVTFKSSDGQEEIYDFYQGELSANGWSIDSEKSFGGQRSLDATKDSRKVTVSITGTQGDSRISVIVTGVD